MNFGFAPVQSQPRFKALRHQAALAETLGFDTLWTHEHHVGATIYPCPLITLAAVAEPTRRIGLGTNMLLLPLYHSLRVAQEAAMVDVLSGGRLILGVSAGYAAFRPWVFPCVSAADACAKGWRSSGPCGPMTL